MESILVPTDFSDNSIDALIYAIHFAGQHVQARIKVIHIVKHTKIVSIDPTINTTSIKVDLEEAKEELKKLEQTINEYCLSSGIDSVDFSYELFSGPPVQSIRGVAKKEQVDLIILGTRGADYTMTEKLLGSTTTEVLQTASCSVLIVPLGYRFETIDNVIYGTNLNHDDPYELWKAMQIIKPANPVIRCVHVFEKESEKEDPEVSRFAKYMVSHSPSIQTIFYTEVGQNTEEVLEEYAEMYNADMVIMYREKTGFWTNLLKRKHTNRMSRITTRPLFVVN